MALSSTTLRDLLIAKMQATYGEMPEAALVEFTKFATILAEAVIEHVTVNGEVTLAEDVVAAGLPATDKILPIK